MTYCAWGFGSANGNAAWIKVEERFLHVHLIKTYHRWLDTNISIVLGSKPCCKKKIKIMYFRKKSRFSTFQKLTMAFWEHKSNKAVVICMRSENHPLSNLLAWVLHFAKSNIFLRNRDTRLPICTAPSSPWWRSYSSSSKLSKDIHFEERGKP